MVILMLDLNHVIEAVRTSVILVDRDTRGHKLSRHEEKRHGGDESPRSTRDGSLEREIYKKRRYAKETTRHDSKWSEHSHGHRVMKKRINGRYSVDDSPDGDDDGRGETGHRRKSSRRHGRRGSDSETQERLEDEEGHENPIGLVLTGEQKKKSIEKDHQVIRRRAMHMIGWFTQISRIRNDGNMGMKEVAQDFHTRETRVKVF